jgi:hypothetical protein
MLENLKVHRLNTIKNKVPGQIQYPFTPVLLFYKNGWKPRPVAFEIDSLASNPTSLRDFCEVTSEIRPMSELSLTEHYYCAKDIDWSKLVNISS